MKKLNTQIAFLGILSVLTLGTIATSCSKSDDNAGYEQPTKGTIDAAVGTYKGKLRSSHLDQYEYFDAVVIVTKVDDQHLKVTPKSGEAYSSVTPKTFKVEGGYNNGVQSVSGILEGYLWYTADVKTLEMATNQQAETEISFLFDGVKQ
ncbi:hypothetical protein H4K35_00685 [Myroides sp. NP-2]|uniref:hypothetical protein n=1 Tax=Myroides sp. NP-2 TaxID=2759945 RepID=UPI0015FB995D|nr:hypothetical protein [Myroides sp. NP-2]MBB1148661.1 hypothetical protein [Myroides sp. NP-2]